MRKLALLGIFAFLSTTTLACRRGRIEPPTFAAATVELLPTMEVSGKVSSLKPALEPKLAEEKRLPAVVDVTITSASPEPASVQMPAYIETEIAGFDLASVDRLVGRHEADGRLKLISLEPVLSRSRSMSINSWPDGAREHVDVWYAEGYYLTDGVRGDYAVLWSNDPDSNLRRANGLYKNASQIEGQDPAQEAILTVDLASGQSDKLILSDNNSEIFPGEGDTFQLTDILLEDGGYLKPVPGATLTFNGSGHLFLDKLPLPSGDYFVGLMAQTREGAASAAYANFVVRNDTVQPNLRAYYDPEAGFQFLFPASWQEPKIESNRLVVSNINETVRLTITTHPDLVKQPVEELKAKVLQSFGDVQILYDDKVSLGTLGALRTVYGYDSDDGAHTGVFLSFVMDDLAYVIDIDGRLELESEVLKTMETIARSFVSRPSHVGLSPGNWQIMKLNDLTMSVPANYRLVSLENGWERFDSAAGSGYVALRVESGSEPIQERSDHWQAVAARGVEEFAYSESYEVRIGSHAWRRFDFSYNHEEAGIINGSLMVGQFEDRLLSLWTEAEVDSYAGLERDVLSIIAASVKKSD